MIDQSPEEERWLLGQAIVPGIAVGQIHTLPDLSFPAPTCEQSSLSSDGEMGRYSLAVSKAQSELRTLLHNLRNKGFNQEAELVQIHLQMTEDPFLSQVIQKGIYQDGKRAEVALVSAIDYFHNQFQLIPENSIRERFEDIEGICLRILSMLSTPLSDPVPLSPYAILFAKTLTAPVIAEVSNYGLGGIVTSTGGAMSHTAIIAKARGIPYVTNIQGIDLPNSFSGTQVIVDGHAGLVVLQPSPDTVQRYALMKKGQELVFLDCSQEPSGRGLTKDGTQISLLANLSSVSEVVEVVHHRLGGVGLYRTEYQALEKRRFPTEQEQVETYSEIVKAVQGKTLVIRVFDFGSDKAWGGVQRVIPEITKGRRFIDLLLDYPQIFLSHLQAMVQASVHGPISILFPMISSVQELDRCLALFYQAYEGVNRSVPVPPPRLGVMVELPCLVFCIRSFLGKVDFLSLGTNDLMQYALAIDRSNSASFDPYLLCHSGLLRLLFLIIEKSREAGLPLSVCGEMASDPLMIPLLIGLGVRELSIPPRTAPLVRHILSSFTIKETEQIAQKVLCSGSAHKTYNFLRTQYCKIDKRSEQSG